MKKTFLLLIPFFALGAGLAQRQDTAVPFVSAVSASWPMASMPPIDDQVMSRR